MAQLALFNEGVRAQPLAYYNGMGPRYWDWRFRLRGTPLMSAQADINGACKDWNLQSLQGRLRPEDFWPLEHTSESRHFLAQARKKDELRVKSEAICSWWEEQGAKRRSDGVAPEDM